MNTLNLYADQQSLKLTHYAHARMAFAFAWVRLGLGLVGEGD